MKDPICGLVFAGIDLWSGVCRNFVSVSARWPYLSYNEDAVLSSHSLCLSNKLAYEPLLC